ncbi:TPA: fimbrial protein [Citrobacter amalonaticus]|uniref:fimbrial protein n=1 Tax=Citrobacter amalonaticus TaxID=35703 RepID=UPI0019039B62|nr:fimbrial protein [Citrobacter amalonaticus]MBJ9328033.1 type 1 fimbrial protein [Citrobacter amalonaticus]HCD1278899.1 type 1 fimbrial protein [Citrobacter amalonaticus]HCL5925973.1 type 1 fimbrial protein [Citrobacter amalonaticus]
MNHGNAKRTLCGLVLALFSSLALAGSDSLNIKVLGMMTEGACVPDLASAWQEVNLGETPTALLKKPGDRGMPIPIVMHFKYCIRMRGNSLDVKTGTRTWDPVQPVLTVSFIAPADADTPQLVQVTGASGIGLRITDAQQNDIRLGQRGKPQFATPPRDELIWYVTPERTRAPLIKGAYQASVNFFMEYD